MNSTIQVLRQIPELQTALNECVVANISLYRTTLMLVNDHRFRESTSAAQNDTALTGALRDLYKDMGKTSEGFPPLVFLRVSPSPHSAVAILTRKRQMLREFAPQFAERSRTGQYAQQDAQEAWGSIVSAMRGNLRTVGEPTSSAAVQAKFVEQYLTGEMTTTFVLHFLLFQSRVDATI